MKQNSNNRRTAAKAQAANATAIFDLAEKITGALPDCTTADWQDVGTSGYVRECLVQAAFALGAITAEQAAELGVTV